MVSCPAGKPCMSKYTVVNCSEDGEKKNPCVPNFQMDPIVVIVLFFILYHKLFVVTFHWFNTYTVTLVLKVRSQSSQSF